MKLALLGIISIAWLLIISFSRCKKQKEEQPQSSSTTIIGTMTFGCKINGKVFVPRHGRRRPGLDCRYANFYTVPNGRWHVGIPAYNYSSNKEISIEEDSLLLVELKAQP